MAASIYTSCWFFPIILLLLHCICFVQIFLGLCFTKWTILRKWYYYPSHARNWNQGTIECRRTALFTLSHASQGPRGGLHCDPQCWGLSDLKLSHVLSSQPSSLDYRTEPPAPYFLKLSSSHFHCYIHSWFVEKIHQVMIKRCHFYEKSKIWTFPQANKEKSHVRKINTNFRMSLCLLSVWSWMSPTKNNGIFFTILTGIPPIRAILYRILHISVWYTDHSQLQNTFPGDFPIKYSFSKDHISDVYHSHFFFLKIFSEVYVSSIHCLNLFPHETVT
jgi:hypothetical protein